MKKWIFYKAVCITDIAVSIFIASYAVYGQIRHLISSLSTGFGSDIEGLAMVLGIIFICFYSDINGLKLLHKLKTNDKISDRFSVTIGMFFLILALLFLLFVVCDCYAIENMIATIQNFSYWFNSDTIIIVAGLFVYSFTSLFKLIFTFMLTKKVRKNNEEYELLIVGTIGDNK